MQIRILAVLSALIALADKDGRFAGTLDIHEPRETILAKLTRLVDG